jgi:protein-disulfide isomerase
MDVAYRRMILGIALAVWLQPGVSQQPPQGESELQALRRELEALKAGQVRIERQLQELKDLLTTLLASRAPEPRELVLNVDGAPSKGEKTARVVLIEFSDYQCPFCARHVRETLPQLEREYIQTGKIRYVTRDFPLPTHRHAFKAAEAARCAGEQGKFWEMHAQLFHNQ